MKRIKRLLAFALTLAMLLPAMGGVSAPEAEAAAAAKPFYMVNWTGVEQLRVDTSDINNVYGMAYFWGSSTAYRDGYLTVKAFGTFDRKEMIASMKEEFDKRPEGTRYMLFMPPQSIFPEAAENYVFLEKGFQIMQDWLDGFLKEYKEAGGKLDGIVSDMEYFDCMWHYLNVWHYSKDDPEAYYKIVSDPRYQTEIRPLLVERGFKFYPSNAKNKTEIYSINVNATSEDEAYSVSRRIWDVVMRNRINQYLTDYLCNTMLRYYPNAEFNDYQAQNSYGWQKENERDGTPEYLGGNSVQAGTSSNTNFYAHRPDANFFSGYWANPVGHNGAYYEETVFNKALYDYNVFKNMYAASGKISAWTAYYDYNYGDSQNGSENIQITVSNTPYYAETLFHMNLLDPTPFIGFIVPGATADGMYAGTGEDYVRRIRVVEQVLDEMTRVAGYADRKPIVTPYSWNDSFLLSGMYAGGRNIWRITPDTSKVSLANFRIEAEDPTFYVNGKTISFPGGKIIETGSISQVGTCGYWVETPAGTNPVIINDADRLYKDPALLEDFENYSAGAAFTSKTALPKSAWQVSGNATVKSHGGNNKALALSGSVTLKNLAVLPYVTAGDNYAKDQAWEVTVTVPNGLNSSASIRVLGCAGDGGFKVSGGKVYYDQSGSDKQMSGVSLSGDNRYIFKRAMDLSNLRSSYYVYTEAGQLVGSAENIPMRRTSLPVAYVSIACSNLNKTAYIDNYKIYTTGVAADLEIYNANTGIKVSNSAAAMTVDTAYRFSWMNATNTIRRGTLVAYRNGTREVIKRVQLLPGADAVETGIIKANGATLQIKWEWDDSQYYPASVVNGILDRYAATAGETVAVVAAKAPAGKVFDKWVVSGGTVEFANAKSATTTFVMPAGGVTLTATYKEPSCVINAVSNNSQYGTVTGGGEYSVNAAATLTAAPNAGYRFVGWKENGAIISNELTVSVKASANRTLEAVFEKVPYTISVTGGTADKTTATVGDTVTLTAGEAPEGKNFINWKVADGTAEVTFADANAATTTFVMPAADVAIEAVFKGVVYDVTVDAGTGSKGAGKYEAGETVTITAGEAPAGMLFDKWVLADGSAQVTLADPSAETTTFTMPAEAVSVKAQWKEDPNATTESTGDGTSEPTDPAEPKPDDGNGWVAVIVIAAVVVVLAGVSVVGVLYGRKHPEKVALAVAAVKKTWNQIFKKKAD